MVGGTIIDIVKVSPEKWWVNCAEKFDRQTPDQCAIYLNPQGEPLDVGDGLWWQGNRAMWTPADRSRVDVELPRIGFSGVPHPDAPRCPTCGCTVAFCQKNGVCAQPAQEKRPQWTPRPHWIRPHRIGAGEQE